MIIIAYKTLSYGSSGSEVKKLQESLNSKGYKLAVDGQFGSATQAAVKDYQKKSNLSVDGIVGEKTWSSLSAKNVDSNSGKGLASSQTKFTYSQKKPVYEKSDEVTSAENRLTQWESNRPEDYKSPYSEDIDKILNDILSREDFSYSMSSDPLYEQYKELYLMNGKKAMMDTVADASALTGGYGNSYGVAAGNEAYNDYLLQLNDIALDLRDRAFQEYKQKGDKLFDDINILRSLDGDEYDKYLDSVDKYYKDGEYLLERLSQMSDSEFEMFCQELESWEDGRDQAFKEYQDNLDRKEFESEMNFKREEAQRDQENKDREYALSVSKAASSSKSNKEDKKENSKSRESYPKTYNEFVSRTGFSGIMTEYEFSLSGRTKALYEYDYQIYLEKMYKKYGE